MPELLPDVPEPLDMEPLPAMPDPLDIEPPPADPYVPLPEVVPDPLVPAVVPEPIVLPVDVVDEVPVGLALRSEPLVVDPPAVPLTLPLCPPVPADEDPATCA